MIKKLKTIALLTPVFLAGCTTLSKGGEKVQIVLVSTNTLDVKEAEAKLKKEGCTFIQNIDAPIALGSTDEYYRLEVGLKNKTAEVGGNAVISSMQAHMGMPIFTKGKVYKCNHNIKSTDV